jgi:hypothetical protein
VPLSVGVRQLLSGLVISVVGLGLGLGAASVLRDGREAPSNTPTERQDPSTGPAGPVASRADGPVPLEAHADTATSAQGGSSGDAQAGGSGDAPREEAVSNEVRREEDTDSGRLRRGRVRRGLHHTYLWSDDALEPPITVAAEEAARLRRERLPAPVRRQLEQMNAAVVSAEKRRLEVEAALGGSPLRESVFQLAAVRSLGSGFVAYPGRDIAVPASPEASVDRLLAGATSHDNAWKAAAVERVAKLERQQANRRRDIVVRVLDLVQEGAGEGVATPALWVADGVAGYVDPGAAELGRISADWSRARARHLRALKEILQ